jgi:hypothetical protein
VEGPTGCKGNASGSRVCRSVLAASGDDVGVPVTAEGRRGTRPARPGDGQAGTTRGPGLRPAGPPRGQVPTGGCGPRRDGVAVGRRRPVQYTKTMQRTIAKVGFWAALVAFVGAVGYIVSAFLQILNVVGPLQDGIIGFGSSLIIATPFLLAMLALHYTVTEEKKFWTHAAVVFAAIYTTYCTLNYVVQLTTVIPGGYFWTFENQQGTAGPLSLLNQTPHSLFWDIDALGYIFLSLATLFAFPVFEKRGFQRWIRLFFLANGLDIPLSAIVYFYPGFSVPQLLLGLPWGILVPGCLLLLALFFRRELHKD